jgi:multidrug efflux system outer membrane protein
MNRNIVLIAIIIFLPSCTGSRYKIPTHTIAQTFNNQCVLAQAEPMREWWQLVGSDVLNQLVDSAIKHNYDLAIAREAIEASRARFNLSAAALLPLITGTLQVAKLGLSEALLEDTLIPQRNFLYLDVGFDAIWEVDFWGRNLFRKKANYARVQEQIDLMHDVQIIVVADVVRTYIDLCAADQALAIIRSQCALERRRLELISAQYTAGLVPRTKVVEEKQDLLAVQVTYEDLLRARAQSYHNLLALLGMHDEHELGPIQTGPIPLLTVEPTVGMPSALLLRRPDIRAAERYLLAKHETVAYAAGEWLPQFSLIGSLDTQSNTTGAWFTASSIAWNFAPSFVWPLINFGRINARIDEARAERREAALLYSQTVIIAFKDVEDSLISYFTYKKQLEEIDELVYAAQEQYQYAADLFETGLTSALEMIEAYRNLLNHQRECIGYEQQLATAVVSLYKALGGGW